MIEVHTEDQYALVAGSVTLAQLEDARPSNLHYRAPRCDLSLEDWILSGGLGVRCAPPTRKEVLGLEYTGAHGTVSVGGRVVKNVAGYDAVRLIVGSDASLEKKIRIERATLRLRPKPKITRLEKRVQESTILSELETLQQLGAMFGMAHLVGADWCIHAEFWNDAPGD
ncbi:MAG: hypothetical protein ACRDAM_19065, partial [Casimicrobium sp.]